MQQQWLPGTPGFKNAADGAPSSFMREGRPADRLNHVLKMNTGFGGVNGAIILGYA
jgi:3-oxoacyl-(acyl-carrier-protein) synthase